MVSPIDYDIELSFLITAWQDIFKVGSCKCIRIGKELFGTRSGEYSSIRVMDNIIIPTFALAEQIHGNIQTKLAGANPEDQVCPTSSKDQ
jgi:hypothetical protein